MPGDPGRYPDVAASAPGRAGADPGESVLASWWVTALGAGLALAGAVGGLWGLLYLRGALSPDNRTNPLREIGVVIGAGATSLAGIALLCGAALAWASARRRAAPATRAGRMRRTGDE